MDCSLPPLRAGIAEHRIRLRLEAFLSDGTAAYRTDPIVTIPDASKGRLDSEQTATIVMEQRRQGSFFVANRCLIGLLGPIAKSQFLVLLPLLIQRPQQLLLQLAEAAPYRSLETGCHPYLRTATYSTIEGRDIARSG
jgi:hypothetical protein